MIASRRALLAAPALLPAMAHAQGAWPDRPVRIIVPFPPGQAADIFTRLVADQLSQRWPQRVVVENRGGGAGAPALEAGARAAPDGYTLIAGTSGTLGVNPSVLPRIPYDAERDFAAITNIAMVPLLLVAHPSFPGRTVQEMAAAVRARPGEVNIASAGPATPRAAHRPRTARAVTARAGATRAAFPAWGVLHARWVPTRPPGGTHATAGAPAGARARPARRSAVLRRSRQFRPAGPGQRCGGGRGLARGVPPLAG